ncbi:acyclic terpene utilization AtuA family protein [Ectothiorhodospiraceae bacterium WFHF3C12]|nr:acyclic terpene utilization AtuA family protein [Ectothiorhodospiraceae bacterium WFHF3C12]
MSERAIRIGGASGYWGDTAIGPFQLVEAGDVDYLIFDYLAEITMSILAKAREKDPQGGYATDFISRVMKPLITQIAEKRIKVLANAGGVNLQACREALEQVAKDAGVDLKIGTVEGDNLLPRLEELRGMDIREMGTGEPLPDQVMSVNAYLGAFPIAAALDAGADIVVTGRCVDSALAVAPLIHEFGWRPDDYDRLAAGGLVGHVIECGAQATGGNFTDWDETWEDWENTGFPIAEVGADGSFVLTKPPGTGGAVTPFTAGEQMLYEIGDPGAYALPDVICDFTGVTMEQAAEDRVLIQGARGYEPTATYKVSATYPDGFGCVGVFTIAGRRAAEKARRQGQAVLNKTRDMLQRAGLGDYTKTALQLVGTEHLYGDQARPEARENREVVLRLGIHHPRREGADIFSKEFVGAGLSMAPGLTGLSPGRPRPTPIVRLFSFLLDKDAVPVDVRVGGEPVSVPHTVARGNGVIPAGSATPGPTPEAEGETVEVPLYRLAVARSGDKGDKANIGVIARKPEYLPYLRAALTPAFVGRYFSHVTRGEVERFDLPGTQAMNFLLHESLDGGGVASLHLDPQAKTYAQVLLDAPIPVPREKPAEWGI